MAVTALVVYNGVEDGIEKVSRFMMPVLLVLVVVIAIYSLTLQNTGADGVTRTGLQGFLYYIAPDFEGGDPPVVLVDFAGRDEPAVLFFDRLHGH